MPKLLVDYVSEALHEARAKSEPDDVVLAFLEALEDFYVGDMEVEHGIMYLADAVRTVS